MTKKKQAPKQKRIPQAIKRAYPSNPDAYKPLGGKTRHYQIKATGEEISRRAYLTATRGVSNEAYAKKPTDEKKQPSRGGRNSIGFKRHDTEFRHRRTARVIIDYEPEKWGRFLKNAMKAIFAQGMLEKALFYLMIEVKGDGSTTRTGRVLNLNKKHIMTGDKVHVWYYVKQLSEGKTHEQLIEMYIDRYLTDYSYRYLTKTVTIIWQAPK